MIVFVENRERRIGKNPAVNKIVKVNPADFSQQTDLWLKPNTRMAKRDVLGGVILNWPAPALVPTS